jgi:hypothetical protein
MKKLALAAMLLPMMAHAGTSPGLKTGQVPNNTQWNSYFSGKADQTQVDQMQTQIGNALQGVSNANAAATAASAKAAAALPAAGLASQAFRGNLDDVNRALADRFSDRLNVKDFGAVGDGMTDDWQAFQNAADVATGHVPTNIGPALKLKLSQSTGFLGVGAKLNGAVEIDVPAGHYFLSKPITVSYQPNSYLHWKGDGSSATELEFSKGIDGLVTTFNPNSSGSGNELARTGAWPGQGIQVDGFHFISDTQIVPLVPGGTNIGKGQGYAGTGIKTTAIPVINASTPPFQIYHDIIFSNKGGWNDGANNWLHAIYLIDPDNLFMDHVLYSDRSLDANRTSVPFWIHSTAKAFVTPGHGFLNLDYVSAIGGLTCFQIDGDAIQGINIIHPVTIGCQDGITWLAGKNTLAGSIDIADGSMGAARYIVQITNASTIFSHDNFYYNTSPPAGTDPIFFNVGGGDTIISHHDQFYGPTAGLMGAGHSATAMFVTGFGTADAAPSHISDDTVSHFDSGIIYGGGSRMNFTNDVVGSDTTLCYRDTSGSTDPTLRGQFSGIYCGGDVNEHDGVGLGFVKDWAVSRYINSGIELGMPGVRSPGGLTGYAGGIDFHSLASTDGTIAGLNDYDCREAAVGGTSGTAGQGGLAFTCAKGLVVSGPVYDHSAPRVAIAAGGTVQAAVNTSGIELAPGGVIASGTLALPIAPADGDTFTVAAEQTITAFTIQAGTASQFVSGAPTTIGATSPVRFKYFAAVNTWDRW